VLIQVDVPKICKFPEIGKLNVFSIINE